MTRQPPKTFTVPAPNFTKLPNVLIDEWLPFLSEVETKVLLVIMRKTFGWHKTRDRISLSQLEEMTGALRQAVLRATKSLAEKGIITKTVEGKMGDQQTFYDLLVNDSNNSYQCDEHTGTSVMNTPPPSVMNTPTKETLLKENSKEKKEKKEKGVPPPTPHSAGADSLCDFFLSKIKERRPQFIVANRDKWAKEFDLLLHKDKRDVIETKALIIWASEHSWWKTACISPSKLRKDFDAMALQMQSDEQKELVRTNRAFALSFKEKYPQEMKALTFDAKYAINASKAKEVPFNLPVETFRQALIEMFGGEYVPAQC